MSIRQYLKEIGRGKDGARALSREQAADLMGQVLDGQVDPLALGAFCAAMRIKGETPEEMAGFLDATEARLHKLPNAGVPTVVLPSYNGARKLPVLTPLLGLLLAQRGVAVVVHGTATEDTRVSSADVLAALGHAPAPQPPAPLQAGQLVFVPTGQLHAGLQALLEVRRVVGLRNSGHAMVKLMNPCTGPALVVSSYTHPEYATSMAATFALTGAHALLLRGTEGEPVADPRRLPRLQAFRGGQIQELRPAQEGPLTQLPDLPAPDASATAAWTREVLDGRREVPPPMAQQVECILRELDHHA